MVTDFGVAKALTASSEDEFRGSSAGLTSRGVALGTPAYMAPEQAAADPAMDHRVDIYAFGATAYEMLSGDPPFTGNSPHAILGAHLADAPPSRSRSLRPGLPPLLAHVVMQCLEKRPADRPQSADEIIRVLDSLATPTGGTVPLSMPRTEVIRARGAGVRRFVLPATAAALAAAVAILAWPRSGAAPDRPATTAESTAALPKPEPAVPSAAVPSPPAAPASLDTFKAETARAPARARTPAPAAGRPSPQDVALLSRLRADAMGAREHAAASGANDSILARGDSAVERARALARLRRTAEAAAQLSAAATLWSAAAARAAVAPPVPPDTVVPPATQPTARPRPAVPSPPSPPAPVSPPAEPQIRALFTEYGAAIESRSVDAIRRVYPGLTGDQAREWQEFFQGVSDVQVELNVTDLRISGDAADARLAGVYVFNNPSTRKVQREPVSFQATLERSGGRWRIASLK